VRRSGGAQVIDRKGGLVKPSTRTALLAAVVLAALAFASTAAADKPIRGTFDDTVVFVDTEVCAAYGFDVHVVQHEFGFFDIWSNKDGSFKKAEVHQNYDATISANGKTIVERDTYNVFVSADGTARFTGATVHIQGPNGIVVHDAGQVVFNPDGTIAYAHGPHDQLVDGVSFCPALAAG
jgi:hypothetical protein